MDCVALPHPLIFIDYDRQKILHSEDISGNFKMERPWNCFFLKGFSNKNLSLISYFGLEWYYFPNTIFMRQNFLVGEFLQMQKYWIAIFQAVTSNLPTRNLIFKCFQFNLEVFKKLSFDKQHTCTILDERKFFLQCLAIFLFCEIRLDFCTNIVGESEAVLILNILIN